MISFQWTTYVKYHQFIQPVACPYSITTPTPFPAGMEPSLLIPANFAVRQL